MRRKWPGVTFTASGINCFFSIEAPSHNPKDTAVVYSPHKCLKKTRGSIFQNRTFYIFQHKVPDRITADSAYTNINVARCT